MPASPRSAHATANLLALATIALWASLAALGAALRHVPPFLLTGLGLLAGSVIALPLVRFDVRRLAVAPRALALGVYGLFGYHFLLFTALQLTLAVLPSADAVPRVDLDALLDTFDG